ncbi:MAG: threonylcarbamoyl-AMP synthase [Chlorobi bacterium]|nr:threonylcarbamoyl-AMP synthase [Chlorobiota bacterium]
MLIKVYEENPAPRSIRQVADCLRGGGTVIIPTDTVYSVGASIYSSKAFDKIVSLKGIKKKDAKFSFIFNNLSMLSDFTKPIPNDVYRLMNRNLPGPFTFILDANNKIPKIFQSKKKTIGIRIPNNQILMHIIEELGHPILTSSIYDTDEVVEYTSDPMLIDLSFGDRVDMIIDGGYGGNIPSTVIDCTGESPVIIRQGLGIIDE